MDKELVMLFKEIFKEPLWIDLNKGEFIGSNVLCNLHVAKYIHEHLERKLIRNVHWMLIQ